MDPDLSKLLVLAIAAVAAVAWLFALAFLLRVGRERRDWARNSAEQFEVVEGPSYDAAIVGEAEVDGQPEDLSEKLASLLAREANGPLGAVKILARDRREVAFEPAGRAGAPFRRGRVRLAAVGSRTRIDYAVALTSGRSLLVIGWIFQACGLCAIVSGLWLDFAHVLPNPNPMIRSQSLQLVQVCHLIWPPFLFANLARMPGRMIRSRMDALIHNLPYA